MKKNKNDDATKEIHESFIYKIGRLFECLFKLNKKYFKFPLYIKCTLIFVSEFILYDKIVWLFKLFCIDFSQDTEIIINNYLLFYCVRSIN